MNRSTKQQTESIFQIFTSFLNTITEDQYNALLNGAGSIVFMKNTDIDSDNNSIDTVNFLDKLRKSDKDEAYQLLSTSTITKNTCLEILNHLNIKSNKNCKKETLVAKIINELFQTKIGDTLNGESNSKKTSNILIEELYTFKNKEDTRAYLKKLKVIELKELAKDINISLPNKTKDKIINSIVQRIIGNKLDTQIIMDTKLK